MEDIFLKKKSYELSTICFRRPNISSKYYRHQQASLPALVHNSVIPIQNSALVHCYVEISMFLTLSPGNEKKSSLKKCQCWRAYQRTTPYLISEVSFLILCGVFGESGGSFDD